MIYFNSFVIFDVVLVSYLKVILANLNESCL